MKVIEVVKNNRTGETHETDWGLIERETQVFHAVAAILGHQADRDEGKVHAFQGRFTTTEIRIVL